jgi:outer membrane protein assembly factor BamB
MRFVSITASLAAAMLVAVGLQGCGTSKEPLPNLSPIANSSDAKAAWRASIGPAGVGFAPVVQGDSVYAAAADGTVVRLGLADGQTRWRQKLDTTLTSGVGADGQIVVVVSRDGRLIALDANGAKRWESVLGTDVAAAPAVGLGLVIVRAGDNRVHAFDAETGQRRWTFQRQNPALSLRQTAGIAISAGSAYVGLPGARLVAIGLTDGLPRWEQLVSISRGTNDIERLSDIVGTPLVIGRDVCVVAYQGRIACFETATGNPSWSNEFSSSSGLDVDTRHAIASATNGNVEAFDRESGKSRWKQTSLVRRQLSAPFVVASNVLIGDRQGLLHVLDLSDGALVGRLLTDGSAIVAAPVGNRTNAVVQTSAGGLFGYSF